MPAVQYLLEAKTPAISRLLLSVQPHILPGASNVTTCHLRTVRMYRKRSLKHPQATDELPLRTQLNGCLKVAARNGVP